MDPMHHDSQKKLSNQFAEFVDLTDEDLEEVTVLESGGIINGVQGGRCGRAHCCGNRTTVIVSNCAHARHHRGGCGFGRYGHRGYGHGY
jgi:hypothetical protein